MLSWRRLAPPRRAVNPKPGACNCTVSGMSGNSTTGASGCGQHNITRCDDSFFCFVTDPKGCPDARPAPDFYDTKWLPCGPSLLD